MKKRLFCLMLGVALVVSACGTTAENSSQSSTVSESSEAPEIILNPLTGEEGFSKDAVGVRPMAVVVSNIKAALPQNGLTSADICFETLAEGGITRNLAIFADYKKMPLVGPVRSVREYFIDFMAPFNAIFVHFGGSTTGYERINKYGIDDIDGMAYSNIAFYYDAKLAAKRGGKEHANFTSAELIQKAIDKKGINTAAKNGAVSPAFDFSPCVISPGNIGADKAVVGFSSYATATFTYNTSTGKYDKSEFGAPQTDLATGAQVSVTNVFVLFASMSNYKDTILEQFDLTSGTGYYITKGGAQEIHWTKGSYNSPFVYTDSAGNSLKVNAGKTWICVVPTDRRPNVTISTTAKVSSST